MCLEQLITLILFIELFLNVAGLVVVWFC